MGAGRERRVEWSIARRRAMGGGPGVFGDCGDDGDGEDEKLIRRRRR